jgi:adenosylcobinamide-phosphate synthase
MLLPASVCGMIPSVILAWPLIAARSLRDHVAAVARPLLTGDLATAREAAAMIVGHDCKSRPSAVDAGGTGKGSFGMPGRECV